MTEYSDDEIARADVLGRLAVYRERRAALHDEVWEAWRLHCTKARIAEASGLSRQHVYTVIEKRERERQ